MNNNQTQTISSYFKEATAIIIIKNGEEFAFIKGDDKFETIISALNETTKNSQEMPAFGVSLDNETKSKMQTGTWIELQFKHTKHHNNMPFDALLIEVDENYQGINIIRKNNKNYEGRCFYLNLKSNMKTISNAINKITK